METLESDRDLTAAQPPPSADTESRATKTPRRSASRGDKRRSSTPSLLVASLAAGLAALISCAEPTAIERPARQGTPIFLNAEAAAAVRTVLGDVAFRIGDAIEDATTRTRFDELLERMTADIEAGLLDAAVQDASGARAALADAAKLDSDGSGDADRSAIGLALDVADTEITNARLSAAGGA